MDASGWALLIVAGGGQVILIIAAIGGILLQMKKVNRIEDVVTDPKTGMRATHEVANSALSKTQDAKALADEEINRLNKVAAELAAKTASDIALGVREAIRLAVEAASLRMPAPATQVPVPEGTSLAIADPTIVVVEPTT